jgi:hypothetical protein
MCIAGHQRHCESRDENHRRNPLHILTPLSRDMSAAETRAVFAKIVTAPACESPTVNAPRYRRGGGSTNDEHRKYL